MCTVTPVGRGVNNPYDWDLGAGLMNLVGSPGRLSETSGEGGRGVGRGEAQRQQS